MKIIIGGAGAVGTHLSKLLSKDHQDCVLIDEYPERLAGLDNRYDIMTGIEHADLFVGVMNEESRNMTACMIAHALGAKKTVARIDNIEYLAPHQLEMFEQMGINSLIYPEVLAAIDITNGLKMSWVRQRWDVHGGALVMLGIKLRKTCEILNQPLKQLCGPDDPYHVVAIKRNNDTLIPSGNDEASIFPISVRFQARSTMPTSRMSSSWVVARLPYVWPRRLPTI